MIAAVAKKFAKDDDLQALPDMPVPGQTLLLRDEDSVHVTVRLQGTMATEGREILAQSNLNITPAETLKEAGELAVAAVKGA